MELAQLLVQILPNGLDKIFFADSGSVAVEVAMKMAIQYQHAKGEVQRQKFATIRSGYHVILGMRCQCVIQPQVCTTLFHHSLPVQYFLPQPNIPFNESWNDCAIESLADLLKKKGSEIAALILEPVVQGAGGMYFYSPTYLVKAQALCKQYGVLLIF